MGEKEYNDQGQEIDLYEKTDVNLPGILFFAVICIALVVSFVLFLDWYFLYNLEKTREKQSQVVSRLKAQRLKLEEQARNKLNSSSFNISKAMKTLVDEDQKQRKHEGQQ